MKKKLLIPLTIWLLWHSCQNISDTTQKNIQDTLITQTAPHQPTKVEYDVLLTAEQKNIIETTTRGYTNFYRCFLPILTISTDTLLGTPTDPKLPNGSTEQTLAHATPHHIYLTSTDMTEIKSLKNTITHEFFHTIKPDTFSITSPYMFKDGYTAMGYHGLSIKVSNKKDQTKFGLFEDAAAEACARTYASDYSVPNVYYSNIWSLVLQMIHRGWITPEDLIHFQMTNDVPWFCGKIFNKKTDAKDIEALMKIFNDIYKTEKDLTPDALRKIEKIRLKR